MTMPRSGTKSRKGKPPTCWPPLPDDAVLLTLDCSSSAIGWSIWSGGRLAVADVIRNRPSWTSDRRIPINGRAAVELIGRFPGLAVSHVAIEWQSCKNRTGPRVQGLATLGQSQGYLLALINERHPCLPVDLIHEREWTTFGGKSHPRKEARADRIAEMFPEYRDAMRASGGKVDSGFDVADAIGIALFRLGRFNDATATPTRPRRRGVRRNRPAGQQGPAVRA